MTDQLTSTETGAAETPNDPSTPAAPAPRRATGVIVAVLAVLVVLAIVAVGALALFGDDPAGETADVNGQGGEGAVHGADDARLVRRLDGLVAAVDTATPEPGSYEYPSADQAPTPHPPVEPGGDGAPEVFTLWLFVFNHPERCTENRCDDDDLGVDTAAQGGAYQVDGRIADGDRLELIGTVRVGQPAARGAPLLRPAGAEVHLAIAPHGRALAGDELWRQLNGPIGGPNWWWGASFAP